MWIYTELIPSPLLPAAVEQQTKQPSNVSLIVLYHTTSRLGHLVIPRVATRLSKGRYDETFAGEDASGS